MDVVSVFEGDAGICGEGACMQVWVPLKGRVVAVPGILVGVRFQSKRMPYFCECP